MSPPLTPARRRPALALIVTLLAAGPASPAFAQDVLVSGAADDGLTLSSAVSRALQDGFVARIARLTSGQAEDSYKEIRGSYLPHLWITSGAGYSNRRDETLIAFDQDLKLQEFGIASLAANEGWFNMFVEQLVVDVRQWRLIEREKLAAEVAQISERQEHEKVALDVTRKFAEVVRLQRQSEHAKAQLEEARWLADQAGTQFEAGNALETEREIAAVHLEQSEIEARVRLAEAHDALAALWLAVAGPERSGAPVRVSETSLPDATPNLSPAAAEEAVAGSPELKVLDLKRRMEQASLSAAGAQRLPTLGFKAGYSHYGTNRFDLYKDEVRVGIDLRIPLFDGFEAKNAISGASKGVEIARLRYQSLFEIKRNRVRELDRKLVTAGERLSLARRRAESSHERMRLTDLRLKAGQASLEEALSARERAARDSQEATNLFFTRFDLWTSMQHEMGRLASSVRGPGAAGSAP